MQKRQQYYNADNTYNQLIAIPASPGIGKSTFLTHFPVSTAYQTYAAKHHTSDDTTHACPIIVPLTFNSQMGDTPTDDSATIGLRILYGAARPMRQNGTDIHWSSQYKWSEFLDKFVYFKSLTVERAIYILRRVYGNRRVLLLIDELSKADDIPPSARYTYAGPEYQTLDRLIMRELEGILDSDVYTDIIVSSLSPHYIANYLLSDSKRSIAYIPLPPLQDGDIGQAEIKAWGQSMSSYYNITEPTATNMLCAAHVLISGHARYTETLMQRLEWESEGMGPTGPIWEYTILSLKSGYTPLSELLLNLCHDISRILQLVPSYIYPHLCTLSLLLSVTPLRLPGSDLYTADPRTGEKRPVVQGLMERNEVYILPAPTTSNTATTTTDTTTTTGTTSDYATNTPDTPTNAYTTTTTAYTSAEQQQGYFLVGAQLPYLIELFKKAFPTITAVNTSTTTVILHRQTEYSSSSTGEGEEGWAAAAEYSSSCNNNSIINVAKLLFQPLIHDRTAYFIHIHTWWVRSVCMTIAARAAVTDSIASILCIHSPSFIHSNNIIRDSSKSNSMCIRLAYTDTDFHITNSSLSSTTTSGSSSCSDVEAELLVVACTPYPRLFDACLRYTDTNSQHICIYMNMSITSHSSSPQAVASQRAYTLINILLYHYTSIHVTSSHIQPPSLQPPSLLEHIHIVYYDWCSSSSSSCMPTTQEEEEEGYAGVVTKQYLISALTHELAYNTALKAADPTVILHIQHYIDTYIHTNIHYTNKYMLDKWLIPSLTVIPRILERVTAPDTYI